MSTILPETDPVENPIVEFIFAGELTAPASATITVSALNGVDAAASAILSGAAQFLGSSVFQRIQPNALELDYELRCDAVDGPDKRVRVGILQVRIAR